MIPHFYANALSYELVQTIDKNWWVCNQHHTAIFGPHADERVARRALRRAQGLPECHDDLTDQGCFVHTHYDECTSDEGDVESGPMVQYSPAYDIYEGDSHRLIFVNGCLEHREAINWDEERFFEGMSNGQEF